jgi:hypothetical protein
MGGDLPNINICDSLKYLAVVIMSSEIFDRANSPDISPTYLAAFTCNHRVLPFSEWMKPSAACCFRIHAFITCLVLLVA